MEKMKYIQTYEHHIGKDGNSIILSHIKNDWYMLVVSDHYDEDHIGLFVHKSDIQDLANFLNHFVGQKA
jgi:hypothetical protein